MERRWHLKEGLRKTTGGGEDIGIWFRPFLKEILIQGNSLIPTLLWGRLPASYWDFWSSVPGGDNVWSTERGLDTQGEVFSLFLNKYECFIGK